MSVLASRDWKAVEGTDFAGGNRTLRVTGQVDVFRTNETPELAEAVPQGINPSILILELAAVSSGDVGGDAVTCKTARFEKPVSERQYVQVDIRGHAVIDVEVEIS